MRLVVTTLDFFDSCERICVTQNRTEARDAR